MRTLGIDLASQPSSTGVALVDWTTRPPTVQFPAATASDRELLRWLADVDKAGIDVPFGWPRAFVETLREHADRGSLSHRTGTIEDREPLCFRRTDLRVRAHPKVTRPPLSVSTDRIGIPALRMAGLEDACRERGIPLDRAGTDGVTCEVYPAASLSIWGLPASGYKRGAGAHAVREQIAHGLADELGLAGNVLLPGVEDHDLLDAFVSALVARATATGRTTGPDDDDREVAAREGWIHLPTVPPASLPAGADRDGGEA